MDKVTRQCPQTTTFLKRKESRSGIEPRSFRLPAERLTARPNRLTKSFESRRTLFILPGVDASRVYVRARALGCFQSYQYPNHSEGADCVGGQLRGDKECPFSGVTKSDRVWKKVPESDARSVRTTLSQLLAS